MGPAGPGRSDRQSRRAGRGGAAASAREVPARQGRRLRRELHGRRDRHPRRLRVRGQRPDVPDPARDADLRGRHREGDPHLAGPGGLPPDAAALVHGRADEPVHQHVDGHHGRRRPLRLPPGPAGQRPHRHTRRRGGPPGPALHPLLGLPQRLPGVRTGRRPCVRLGLPRPHRRHPQPPTAGHRERDRRLSAVRLVALRGVLRGVPGRDRHPRGAGPSARARGGPGWQGPPP